jgi:cysteine desulfurase/selenocysteine lyase
MRPPFDVHAVRADFPILHRPVHGDRPLVYLDSAATSQKPQAVIDRLTRFYAEEYGTVRRGAYSLSQHATSLYEEARQKVATFIGAPSDREVVFVRGVTEGINLVATGWGRKFLREGDEIVISEMEHHANIVPWQLACRATGAQLRVIPVLDDGSLDLDAAGRLIGPRTRIVSIVHVSNALGTVNPVALLAEWAHAVGAVMLVDGAQSAPHLPVDVKALGCDFYVASGHKMLGPTGAGFLWARHALLEAMDPYQGGGEMIDQVDFEGSTWEEPPWKFEAGTPAFADVIGLGAAIDYLTALGMERVDARDRQLVAYATERLETIPGLRLVGRAPERSGLCAFQIEGIQPLDLGMMLDPQGICIRVGQHCAQPAMRRFGVHSTARASFGVYTLESEIDALVEGIHLARELLL